MSILSLKEGLRTQLFRAPEHYKIIINTALCLADAESLDSDTIETESLIEILENSKEVSNEINAHLDETIATLRWWDEKDKEARRRS